MRLVAVGDVMVDVVAAGSGHSARIGVRAGGSALNAARAAAQLGASAAVIGAVGEDAGATIIRAELARAGVEAQLTEVAGGATGTFLVVDGDVRAQPGPAPTLPERIEADVVLVSGYLPRETVRDALRRSRATWVALAATGGETVAGADAVFANEREARELTGAEPRDAVGMLGTDHRLACVTLGAAGALGMLDGRVVSVKADGARADAPGAGDAFAAAMLVALTRGDDLEAALRGACRFAAGVLDSER